MIVIWFAECNVCLRNHVTTSHDILFLYYSSHLPLQINSVLRAFALAAA